VKNEKEDVQLGHFAKYLTLIGKKVVIRKSAIIKMTKFSRRKPFRPFYHSFIFLTILLPIALFFSIFWESAPEWVGVGEDKVTIESKKRDNSRFLIYLPDKSIWDWVAILASTVLPIVILLVGNNFQEEQKKRDEESLRESNLQTYLDSISALILDKSIYNNQGESTISIILEAKTKTIIRRLEQDCERQKIIFLFLLESRLMPSICRSHSNLRTQTQSKNNQLEIDGWSLQGIVLNNTANLKGFYFKKANLEKARFIELDIAGCTFIEANLKEIDLTASILTNSNFNKADLTKSILTEANLTEANLTESILTEADLTKSTLIEANLSNANLEKARLDKANLKKANLREANLKEAILKDGTDLKRANLTKADLTKADLTGVDLTGADLTEAKLIGAKLIGAKLIGANLTKADLTNADFTEAKLIRANFYKANFRKTCLTKASLTRAIFYKAKNLDDRQVIKAYFWKEAIYSETEWDQEKGWLSTNDEENQKIINNKKLKTGLEIFYLWRYF
jgi:uncharacterized protein YjbI with pentapeptide repeats